MNRILKNITIASLCFILIGIGFAGCGWLLGGTFEFTYLPFEQRFVTSNDTEYYVSEEETDSFTDIDIQSDAIDIEIITGDTYSISYPEDDSYQTSYSVKNGKLIVNSTTKSRFALFSFGIDLSPYDRILTITVPMGTELGSLSVKNDLGGITLKNLSAADMVIDSDYGEIDITNISSNTASLTLAKGSLTISESKLGTTKLQLDYGDCDIFDSSVNELAYSGDKGNFTAKKLLTEQADISLDLGSCSISDSAIDKLKAALSSGDCDIRLTGSKEDYTINLCVDLGDIEVNGHEVNGQYTAVSQKNNIIDITSDLGDIELNFNQ